MRVITRRESREAPPLRRVPDELERPAQPSQAAGRFYVQELDKASQSAPNRFL